MTVGELIKALKKFDNDAEVVVKGVVDASECDENSLAQLPIISADIEGVDKDNGFGGGVSISCQFEENPDAEQAFGNNYEDDDEYYNEDAEEYQDMHIVDDDDEEEDEFY